MDVSLRQFGRGLLVVAGIGLAAAGLQAQANDSLPVSTKQGTPGFRSAPPSDGYDGPRTLEAQKALAAGRQSNLVQTYGTADTIIYELPSAAFSQADPGMAVNEDGQGAIFDNSGTNGRFFAPVNLPSGALVNYLDLYYNVSAASGAIQAILYSFDTGGAVQFEAEVDSNSNTGFGYNFFLINPPIQIDNSKRYMVYVYTAKDSTMRFSAVNMWYHLQVSPAPASATFNDVPTSDPGFQYIEALVSSGITAGCGGGNYCPDGTLTRRQMAVFLAKALGLHFPY